MITLIYSLLVSYGIGHAICRLIWPSASGIAHGRALAACVSFGIGTGVTSCMYFWWLASGAYRAGFAPYAILEVLVFLALSAAARRTASPAREPEGGTAAKASGGIKSVVAVLFVIAAAAMAVSFIMFSSKMPHGEWDAYSIWNQHARFMSRQPELWTRMFDEALRWSHPDYPLMLPATVARCWMYAGAEYTFAAQCVAFLFMAALTATAVFAVSLLKGKTQGILCGLAVLSANHVVQYSTFQYADIPLAYLIAASVSMYLVYCGTGNDNRLLTAAGLIAAIAAWTKNEGIAFFAVSAIALFIAESWRGTLKRGASALLWFICGALPVILTLAYFKAHFAPQNDIISFTGSALSGQDGGIAGRLLDPNRYAVIAGSFIHYSYFGGFVGKAGIFIYLLAAGIAVGKGQAKGVAFISAVLAGMVGVYFLIYLLSPQELGWYVFCSLGRLLVQVFPAFMVAFFMSVRSADEILSYGKAEEVK
ncbi:MAG: phospholipid carrier-dependent glycosyltransferase [Candidatus Omnitrophica bacterium]|nr:phospholipid carrier-dependent glycosyltransferase [Candidatus Omnitrophota bacterium]MDD5737476.1 phospholipid carrier-dependent glycosyltransferase [Candidatus Omnitrophota bacterium]